MRQMIVAMLAPATLCLSACLPNTHETTAPSTQSLPHQEVDHAALLEASRGDRSRVVVVPSDSDDEAQIVAHLRRWKAAGTQHVLPLSLSHPERSKGLFRLANIIELAGRGPHTVLKHETVRAALVEARKRGTTIVGDSAHMPE